MIHTSRLSIFKRPYVGGGTVIRGAIVPSTSVLGAFDIVLDSPSLLRVQRVRPTGASGSSNEIYTFDFIPDLVMRLCNVRVDSADDAIAIAIETLEREMENNLRLAEQALGPLVYSIVCLHIGTHATSRVRIGVLMERLDTDLEAASATQVASLFVSRRGEDALVAMYTRAAFYMRCIDTKPGNVVMHVVGDDVRMRLIDVDPTYCGASRSERPITGLVTLWDVSRALGSVPSARHDATSPLYAAAISLLIHCVAACGSGASPYGYPYARTTRVLLTNWDAMIHLVKEDGIGNDTGFYMTGRLAPRRRTVHERLSMYGGVNAYQGRTVDGTMGALKRLLELQLTYMSTRVLSVCAGTPDSVCFGFDGCYDDATERWPDLYRRAIQPMGMSLLRAAAIPTGTMTVEMMQTLLGGPSIQTAITIDTRTVEHWTTTRPVIGGGDRTAYYKAGNDDAEDAVARAAASNRAARSALTTKSLRDMSASELAVLVYNLIVDARFIKDRSGWVSAQEYKHEGTGVSPQRVAHAIEVAFAILGDGDELRRQAQNERVSADHVDTALTALGVCAETADYVSKMMQMIRTVSRRDVTMLRKRVPSDTSEDEDEDEDEDDGVASESESESESDAASESESDAASESESDAANESESDDDVVSASERESADGDER